MDKRNANKGIGGAYPMGYRALQLPDSNTVSYFLASFGRPDRVRTCDCERTSEPSMAQALHIANGDTINEKLAAKDNRLSELLASGKSNDQLRGRSLHARPGPCSDGKRAGWYFKDPAVRE